MHVLLDCAQTLLLSKCVDNSIAKKVNSSIISTTLFNYDIFVTAQVWLISQGEKLIAIEAHHAKHNSVHQQHVRTKSSYL